ncbi:heparanase-like [Littorina saxatilis]|uniref:Uncharacterized protein n=1 Tax=Littorina saxatilis TaxID=31220 RepID=A0AAN9GA85_9CAEN
MKPSASLFILITFLLSFPLANGYDLEESADANGTQKNATSKRAAGERATVTVDYYQSMNIIGSKFVGVTIDSWHFQAYWNGFPFSSKKVQNLARAMAPNILRIGGTSADKLSYDMSGHAPPFNGWTFLVTPESWQTINQFVRDVGWDFIIDLNALKRNADGSWNPDNARELLQFSAHRKYTIAGFELGNEYDMYQGQFNTTVSPQQLAKDVASLKRLLAEFPAYSSSFIVGPEVAAARPEYFHSFLAAGGAKVVDAASFHHYYYPDTNTDPNLFTSIKTMDTFYRYALDPAMTQSRQVDPQLPVWLSETSSTYVNGVHNVADRFVAGFLWLDKLGLCALHGVKAVIRQDLYGETYSILDKNGDPRPDYWLTVLYKRIVRGHVFLATARQDVRVYSACANHQHFAAGSLAVYMLNPNSFPVTFDLPQFSSQPRMIYTLTGWDGDRLSQYTSLNGVKLELVNDELPKMQARVASPGHVTAPPYSFTFVVFHHAHIPLCLDRQ